MRILQDSFGRKFHYLRLSVTDQCNFRCMYCLPDGCEKPQAQPLSGAEIGRLVRGFAALGFWKVRVTGGEPTLRRDICEIMRDIATTPGIRRVGLTTNGYRLKGLVPGLRAAGLSSLNVSLDSLSPERFEQITGSPRLEQIVAGIEAALEAGIPSVKVNAVLLQGLDDRELDRFLAWTSHLPLTVRFIELMETGDNGSFFRQYHLGVEEIRQKLEARGWAMLERDESDGPATTFGHPGHKGKTGLIAPYSVGFCDSCNRLRVSSTGDLRLCLFGDGTIPLRPYLQSDDQREDLLQLIESSIGTKPASHLLDQGQCGSTANLAATGG